MSRSKLLIPTILIACIVTPSARAQLREDEVLVVYDSAVSSSRLVCEHYAGSAKVPGGVGGVIGARAGVHVFNVNPGAVGAGSQITHDEFITRFRDPIRAYLDGEGLARRVRCIVLTKGLPHRIMDTDSAGGGDNPGVSATEFNDGDATYASVDSELCLLWQNLSANESGGTGDSRADGVIENPYHQQNRPIRAWPTGAIRATKAFTQATGLSTGQGWMARSGPLVSRLTPGDMYLVCRLDGDSVDDVRAMIDRAQNIFVDTDNVAFVLDESAHGAPNNEFDDDGTANSNAGDDFEQTRDLLLVDGRIDPANVHYNNANGAAGFTVGPLVSFDGEGIVVGTPVLLLAHEGANHTGAKPGQNGGPDPSAANLYAESFTYAPGAVFNTVESFNGRSHNGLGDLGQEQVADFIGAGGTFGVASVYEPFTISLPDNEFLVGNFLLGTLSWGEAAYTAIPFLSWTGIVIGDPLATVRRDSDDINGDGVVTIDDLYAWSAAPSDVNGDGDINEEDRALVEASARGVERVSSAERIAGARSRYHAALMHLRQPITLWRLATTELWRLLLLTTLVFVSVIAFAAAVKPLADGKVGPLDAIKFMLLAMPPMLQYSLPFAAGFGATLAYHRLASQNEALAAHAGGISHRSLLLPSMVTGVVLAVFLFVLANSVIPRFLRSMEELIKQDVTRLLVNQINRGDPVRIDGRLIYADLARELKPELGSRADKVLYLKGLLMVDMDDDRNVRWEATARSATVWLLPRAEDGVEKMELVFQPEDFYAAGDDKKGQGSSTLMRMEVPNAFGDDPKFLTWRELNELRAEPTGMNWIERRRRTLACHLAQRSTLMGIQAALTQRGHIDLIDSNDWRFRIYASGLRAAGEDGQFLVPPAGASEIRVDREVAGGGFEHHRAATAYLRARPEPSSQTDPLTIELSLREFSTDRPPNDSAGGAVPGNEPAREKIAFPRLRPDDKDWLAPLDLPLDDVLAMADERLALYPDEAFILHPTRELRRKLTDLMNEILSKQHERLAMSLACLVMVLTGAVMAMRLADSVPLVVYLWSFFPALASVLTVSAGQQMVHDHGFIALPILWGGVVALGAYTFAEYRKLARH